MSELIHNMSAPPRSNLEFRQYQLKKYLAFNPLHLATLLKKLKFEDKVYLAAEQYVKTHPELISSPKKPTGYMLAEYIKLRCRELEGKLNTYNYDECDDIELMILVFASTVGDLYIPDRPLSFERTKFDKILLFPQEDVNS